MILIQRQKRKKAKNIELTVGDLRLFAGHPHGHGGQQALTENIGTSLYIIQ